MGHAASKHADYVAGSRHRSAVRLFFSVGGMQGYLNIKGYGEFDAANRPSGWNTWLTFAISPAAPDSTVAPTRQRVMK
ncbi:hypothetical protein ABIB73_000442 [Bradyrhizobium sp. F1.4.3]